MATHPGKLIAISTYPALTLRPFRNGRLMPGNFALFTTPLQMQDWMPAHKSALVEFCRILRENGSGRNELWHPLACGSIPQVTHRDEGLNPTMVPAFIRLEARIITTHMARKSRWTIFVQIL